MQFAINDGLNAPLIVTAAADTPPGTGFTVTLTAAQTAALATGRYTWGEVFTSIADATEKAVGRDGLLNVLPGISATAMPTPAQNIVTLLQTVLAKFATSGNVMVSFNGQSFTRANMAEYQKQLVYWQARVIAEQARINALRGNRAGGEIGVKFIQPVPTLGLYPTWRR